MTTTGMAPNDFMMNLQSQLITEKGIAETTAKQYIQTLYKLNGGKNFTNLGFTRKTEEVQKVIDTYAPSTQSTQYATLSSVLSLFKDKPAYKKTYAHWFAKTSEAHTERSKEDPHKKTETQKENWSSWEDVEKKKSELSEAISLSSLNKKTLTAEQSEKLLQLLVLSLYTDIPPRRNQDYTSLVVVKKLPKEIDTNKNYYSMTTHQFVFNKYKTAKTYGQQTVEAPESLQKVISVFIKYHPNKKEKEIPLLVGVNPTNGITRILNKIFDKKIGSSMLRHIFLSDNLGEVVKNQEQLANDMAHSVPMQRAYIKTD